MIRRANHIEAVSRQAQVKCLYKRAGREFGRQEHVAKNANALSGDHRLDRMQLLPEAQVVHVLEFGHIAPLASRSGQPPLPGWSLEIGWRPVAMNEDVFPEVGSSFQASAQGSQFRIADGPEAIAQELVRDAIAWRCACVADRDIDISGT